MAKTRVFPNAIPLPPELIKALAAEYRCSAQTPCAVYYEAGADFAVAVGQPSCIDQNGGAVLASCSSVTTPLYRRGNQWLRQYELPDSAVKANPQAVPQVRQGWKDGAVEVRPVTRRQVFIGGEPIGDAFN
jgi:hypothetical protein